MASERMPLPLGNAMHIMCSHIRTIVRAEHLTSNDHQDLCHRVAEEYQLYYNNLFPVWLSRVVDGIIRDVESGESDTL